MNYSSEAAIGGRWHPRRSHRTTKRTFTISSGAKMPYTEEYNISYVPVKPPIRVIVSMFLQKFLTNAHGMPLENP